MEELFNHFWGYIKEIDYNSLGFWGYPIGTLFLIWVLTTVGMKLLAAHKKFKTIFAIHNAWICASLIVATILIGEICYLWSINYFAEKSHQILQFPLLLSLFISLLIPILSFISLRNFFTNENINEIVYQPKTQTQLERTITDTKKSFRKKKFCYLMLLSGFLVLLLVLNKGQNLITVVFDNSGSMESTNATQAISETLDNLEKNNEIIITTLDGLGEKSAGGKASINDILSITDYSKLQGGNVVSYPDPISAKNGHPLVAVQIWGSPICEAIWKSFLFIKMTKSATIYDNMLLIIITDGDDDVGKTIPSGKFFFDDASFAQDFPTDKVFLIDYSKDGSNNPFLQKFQASNCQIFPVTNNKQEYLNALDIALNSFKNNWYLIYWTIIITALMTTIGLLIEPKKMV